MRRNSSLPIKKTSVRTCRLRHFAFYCLGHIEAALPANLGHSSDLSEKEELLWNVLLDS